MPDAAPRVFAVDWSGKDKRAGEAIWLAEAAEGQIIQHWNGLDRQRMVEHLIAMSVKHPNMIVGFDFAFSMPGWYVTSAAADAVGFWHTVEMEGEAWLSICPTPFYGLAGKKKPLDCELFRETEKRAPGAKSVFQTNGPGAVGTGSIRGMPFLLKLRSAGWKIWPFDPPGFPLAIEIYPRLLTGPVEKTAWKKRLDYLTDKFPELDPRFMERAAGSEDSFDAAISALAMDKYRDSLRDLPMLQDDIARLEGEIWRPPDQDAITSNMPLEQQDSVYGRTSRTVYKTAKVQAGSGGDDVPSSTGRKRKRVAKPCHCGCGEMTGGGTFRPGHDARFKGAMLRLIDEGGPNGEEALERLRAFPNLVNIRDAEERLRSGPN